MLIGRWFNSHSRQGQLLWCTVASRSAARVGAGEWKPMVIALVIPPFLIGTAMKLVAPLDGCEVLYVVTFKVDPVVIGVWWFHR